MPYCEPHRTALARIIDLEIMRLERRATRRAKPVPRDGERAKVVRLPRS